MSIFTAYFYYLYFMLYVCNAVGNKALNDTFQPTSIVYSSFFLSVLLFGQFFFLHSLLHFFLSKWLLESGMLLLLWFITNTQCWNPKLADRVFNLGSESYRSRVMPYFDIIRHLYLLSYYIKLNYSYRFINKKFNNRSWPNCYRLNRSVPW